MGIQGITRESLGLIRDSTTRNVVRSGAPRFMRTATWPASAIASGALGIRLDHFIDDRNGHTGEPPGSDLVRGFVSIAGGAFGAVVLGTASYEARYTPRGPMLARAATVIGAAGVGALLHNALTD